MIVIYADFGACDNDKAYGSYWRRDIMITSVIVNVAANVLLMIMTVLLMRMTVLMMTMITSKHDDGSVDGDDMMMVLMMTIMIVLPMMMTVQ